MILTEKEHLIRELTQRMLNFVVRIIFISGNFYYSLFLGMVMYANEVETKEK